MKILYDYQIFSDQNYGGPSKYFVKLAEKIYEMKHDPEIIAGYHINEYLNDIKHILII